MSSTTEAAPQADELPTGLALATAPLHKLALGSACGIVGGIGLALLTLVHLARSEDPYPLVLLGEYLWGYDVSVTGAVLGAFWGFWLGFFGGWFFAFARNFVVGVYFIVARARADMQSDILDHI